MRTVTIFQSVCFKLLKNKKSKEFSIGESAGRMKGCRLRNNKVNNNNNNNNKRSDNAAVISSMKATAGSVLITPLSQRLFFCYRA